MEQSVIQIIFIIEIYDYLYIWFIADITHPAFPNNGCFWGEISRNKVVVPEGVAGMIIQISI
jgi:hypothetical protein